MEEDIKLKENEGAIVLREDAVPEIYAPQSAGDMPDSIRSVSYTHLTLPTTPYV